MLFERKEFEDAVNSIQAQIESIEGEINVLGKSSLICKNKKGHIYFTEYHNSKEVGISRDSDKVYMLARKKYLIKLLKILNNNLNLLQRCADKYRDPIPEMIIKEITSVSPNFPGNLVLSGDKMIIHNNDQNTAANQDRDSWANSPYDKNPYYAENLRYITNAGIPVRSKSEREIANVLEAMNIPFRYDAKVSCNNKSFYVDFLILRPDNTYMIWEHLGLADDNIYMAKNQTRIKDLINSGYSITDNLVLTLESDISDSRNIRKIIKRYYY